MRAQSPPLSLTRPEGRKFDEGREREEGNWWGKRECEKKRREGIEMKRGERKRIERKGRPARGQYIPVLMLNTHTFAVGWRRNWGIGIVGQWGVKSASQLEAKAANFWEEEAEAAAEGKMRRRRSTGRRSGPSSAASDNPTAAADDNQRPVYAANSNN